MSVTIYGASDDLIEIEGDLEEEFGAYDSGEMHIAVSTGLLATIAYTDAGFWRIAVLRHGTTNYILSQGRDNLRDPSDRLTIHGQVEWVVVGEHAVKARPT